MIRGRGLSGPKLPIVALSTTPSSAVKDKCWVTNGGGEVSTADVSESLGWAGINANSSAAPESSANRQVRRTPPDPPTASHCMELHRCDSHLRTLCPWSPSLSLRKGTEVATKSAPGIGRASTHMPNSSGDTPAEG